MLAVFLDDFLPILFIYHEQLARLLFSSFNHKHNFSIGAFYLAPKGTKNTPDVDPVSDDPGKVLKLDCPEPSPEPDPQPIGEPELPVATKLNSETEPNPAPEELDPELKPGPGPEPGTEPNPASNLHPIGDPEETVRPPLARVSSGVEKLPPEVEDVSGSTGSCVIEIRNLARPFTTNSLIQLLKRTGRIADGGFWLDPRKSRAVVKVSNVSFFANGATRKFLLLENPKTPLYIRLTLTYPNLT